MMLREDVARAACAAVWARAIPLSIQAITPGWLMEKLYDIATFLAHLNTGAIEIGGDIPEVTVHPWDCALNFRNEFPDANSNYVYTRNHINCGKFWIYLRDRVPETAIEAALVELRSRKWAAGAVVRRIMSTTTPAPPSYVSVARRVVHILRSRLLSKLNSPIHITELASRKLEIDITDPAGVSAGFAAIETGNWVAEVESFPSRPDLLLDILGHNMKIWMYGMRIETEIGGRKNGRVVVEIFPTQPPRAWRPAFAAAYAKWYGRLASFSVERQLEAVGA
ncbi:MAG: hypothetical protein RXS42_07620 [Nitrososphaeria archaeon]